MIELFIEGQLVDTTDTFSSLLTYAIDDITNFGSRETTFSKTIILPGTKKNNLLFGNLFDVNVSNDYSNVLPNKGINFNAAISAKAYIFNDNLQCFKGIARVLEISIVDGFVEYEISVFGELGGFIGKLGNKKLEDLDFSEYNHTYSIANITGSWDSINGLGYYYPLMDYGNYSALKHDWKYKTFRPALYAKQYIDKIFAQTGYQYTCDLFNTDRFKGLVIPHNTKTLTKKGSKLATANVETGLTIRILNTLLKFNSYSLTDFTYSAGIFTYTNVISQSLDIKFNANGNYVLSDPDDKIIITFLKNNVELQRIDLLSTLGVVTDFSIEFTFDNQIFNQNDNIKINILTFVENVRNPHSITFNFGELNINGNATILVNVNLGDEILLNDTIPKNILQKDFIASIVKLFNLYIFEDRKVDNLLLIKPFVDFYANAQTTDWSQKIDRGSAIKIKPMSELNSRYYSFIFKDDSDYHNDLYKKRYNLSYGAYLYDSFFEFAHETETIELIFSPTVLVGYAGEDKVYSTIFKRTGPDSALVEENVDSNIRLLQAKKITGVTSYNVLDDSGGTLTSLTSYGYAGHFDDPDAPANDIQFGTPKELFYALSTGALNINQFNVYYSSYMAEITDKDSKLLTATFRLQLKDIYNLDFSKLIYIDGSLFRLNKITDFNATKEDTCSCELLKVINKIY